MTNETKQDCNCACEPAWGTVNHYYCGCRGAAISIGENGNWFIGCKDTGVSALGGSGKSAYEIAVEHGFAGTEEEWLASLKGSPGAPGAAGPQGPKGEDGTSLRFDVLFEGNANTLNNFYSLSKPITGYKLVVIFGGVHRKTYNDFIQKNGLVLSGEDIEFGDTGSTWSVLFQESGIISGTFTDNRTIKIRRADVGTANNSAWDYVAVTKIIGIN